MEVMRYVRNALIGAFVIVSAPVAAQQCDVFTDVGTSDSFCPSVQWLKNRSITTGCTQTAYCPFSNVTRAQMALFMERLGTALMPTQFGASTGGASLPPINNSAPPVPLCVSGDLPAANFPRRGRIRGTVSMTATGNAPLRMFLMHDANPPGTWDISANPNALVVPPPNGFSQLSWSSELVSIQAGSPYRFAIGFTLSSGASGLVNVGAYQCQLEVVLFQERGSSPPYDD